MRKSARTGLLSVVVLCAAALVGLVGPTSASAASGSGLSCVGTASPYPSTLQATIFTSTTTPAVGEKFEVSGEHFVKNEAVKIYIGGSLAVPCDSSSYTPGTFVGTGHTDADGNFDPQVTMPAGYSGTVLLIGIGATGLPYDFASLNLQIGGSSASGTSSPPGPPAHTGVDIALMLGVAVVLLGAGVLFTRGGRRRRASHT